MSHADGEPDGRHPPTDHDAPDLTIDGGDLACARLLILLRRRVADLPDGAVVHLIATDPVAPIDLPAWCRMTGHTYLGRVDAADPTYAVRVTGRPTPTDPGHPWRASPEAPAGR